MLNWLFLLAYMGSCIYSCPAGCKDRQNTPLLHFVWFFPRSISQGDGEYRGQMDRVRCSLQQWRCFILRLSIVRNLITRNKPNVSYLIRHSQGTRAPLVHSMRWNWSGSAPWLSLAPSWQACNFWEPPYSPSCRKTSHLLTFSQLGSPWWARTAAKWLKMAQWELAPTPSVPLGGSYLAPQTCACLSGVEGCWPFPLGL